MSRVHAVLSVFSGLLVIGGVHAKVFSPCDLAQELHRIIDVRYLYKEIPLLVCAAGFQNYDTQFFNKKPDGTYYAGIFGIHSSTIKWMARYKGNLTDDDIYDDLTIFSNHVLQLDGQQKDDTVYDYFVQNCKGKDVERVRCYLNPYVTKDYIVYHPKSKSSPGRLKTTRTKNTYS
ncbi:hypothetical protein GE061_012621 [Apolygus lucorum]|uniref:MHC class I-like antigen recognition-like domain-containing protein n=1 Tax=Apolygus lucorum TaxID=248454 RepID=A0A8S9XUV6_APOLU|nr:hypothetical protein GE061_012621 [Apolygus lucorum]